MGCTLVEKIAAHATPARMPAEGDDRREQRNWVVRVSDELPDGWTPERGSVVLTQEADSAVRAARAARGLGAEDSDAYRAIVRLMLIDARHLVVNVNTIKLEEDDSHAYLVAASAALRALDSEVAIEEIQGIPRRYWRAVIGE